MAVIFVDVRTCARIARVRHGGGLVTGNTHVCTCTCVEVRLVDILTDRQAKMKPPPTDPRLLGSYHSQVFGWANIRCVIVNAADENWMWRVACGVSSKAIRAWLVQRPVCTPCCLHCNCCVCACARALLWRMRGECLHLSVPPCHGGCPPFLAQPCYHGIATAPSRTRDRTARQCRCPSSSAGTMLAFFSSRPRSTMLQCR